MGAGADNERAIDPSSTARKTRAGPRRDHGLAGVIGKVKEELVGGKRMRTPKVELLVGDQLRGTYFFAADRQHVMTRYRSADGSQTYDLQTHERTDYWTIR